MSITAVAEGYDLRGLLMRRLQFVIPACSYNAEMR